LLAVGDGAGADDVVEFPDHMHFAIPGLGGSFKPETASDTISSAVALLMMRPEDEQDVEGAPAGYVHEFYPLLGA
jgi:hypothetical protein